MQLSSARCIRSVGRLRLTNFQDSFAGLFQRKDPREGGPLLDIERALNKLEKVAIKFRKERDRPLVLIFNNMHFVADDPLFLLIQQRAEAWAQAGVLTVVFVSDDFAPYRRLSALPTCKKIHADHSLPEKSATRMRVLNVPDLTPTETHLHLSKSIASLWPDRPALTCAESDTIWDLIGGRLSFLGRLLNGLRSEIDAGHHGDDAPLGDALVRLSQGMIENERGWLEHWLGLIPDHDDDVMDEQKVSSCSWVRPLSELDTCADSSFVLSFSSKNSSTSLPHPIQARRTTPE